MTYVREHFDGASLPSPWSALTAATGTITMTDSGVRGALAANGDAAAIYRSFDHTRDAIYWYCAAGKYTGSSLTPWPAMRLMHSASAPVAGTRASFSILAQHLYYSPSVTYDRINYSINPTGTNQNWQESTQTFTTGGTVITPPAEAPDSDYRLYGMQWDATNARVRWMYGHTVSGSSENPDYGPKIQTLTDWVSLSSILNGTSTTLWLVLGWPETNFWIGAGSFHIEWFSEQYGSNLDVYCNGKATIGGNYNITHHHGHDLRAGNFVPGTRAQIAIDKGTAGQWDDNKTQWGSAILAADGKYVQSYNGDAGSTALQIGIATATSPYGPWTKYASNPVIPSTGGSGTDYEQYTRFNVLVEDWLESDSAKRYKLIVNMTDASSVTRTGLFYASAYTGPYTYDGRLLEDDATETQIAFRGQPVFYNGLWHLFYNAEVGGVNTIRYATGSTLRAGAMTKANTTLSTEAVGAVEVTLTAVSGRTWTCASTTGLVKDMFLVCTQTSSGDTYGTTRIRKIISSTQFEVYHTCAGAASGTVCRSANYGTDNALNHVINIEGTWYFIMTTFKAFTSHASYSAHHEWNSLFVGGSSPTDASAIDWAASPIVPMGRDSWNTTISNENVRVLHTPFRFYTLTADTASFALTGNATGLTAQRVVTASAASYALTGVDAALTYTPIGGYTLTADPASFTLTGNATGLTAQRTLTASQATFTLSGTATGLTAQRTLTASAASFTLTGTDTALTAQRLVTATAATFALTGIDVGLTYTPVGAYTLTADTATFSLTGVATGLTTQRLLSASVGAYALTGVDAALVYSPLGSYTLTADAGVFTLTGVDAGLTTQRVLTASAATFVLTGIAATLTKTGAYALTADAGAFTLTGNATGLLAARQLAATVRAFTLTGNAAGLTYSGSYRGAIRLTSARGPSTAFYSGAGPAIRLTPVDPAP